MNVESTASVGVGTALRLVEHATGKVDDAARFLDKPRAQGGRREAGLAAVGALHEAALLLEHAATLGADTAAAAAQARTAVGALSDRLPAFIDSSYAITRPAEHTGLPRPLDAIATVRTELGKLAASRTLREITTTSPGPLDVDGFEAAMREATKLTRPRGIDGVHRPLPIESRLIVARARRDQLMTTPIGTRALADLESDLAARTPTTDGSIPTDAKLHRLFGAAANATRIDRSARGAVLEARATLDDHVAEHLRIMREGLDLDSPATTPELLEMVAAHTAASADSAAAIVEAGRYRLLSQRLQRWQEPDEAIRHAYDAAVSVTRASLLARRLPEDADELVPTLQKEVAQLEDHVYENSANVRDVAGRGVVRRSLLATRLRPEQLERTDLHETIANRVAQLQARHGEPLHRLQSYREAFEEIGALGQEVGP